MRTLPAPPGQVMDLRANAAGDLYVRTATNVLWMDIQNPEEGWNALALDGVVDLTENAGREVFARQNLKTRFAIHRLAGANATPVTTTPNVPCEHWYVDALGRAWLQNRERLLVVGKNETLLERPMGQPGYGIRFRHPCEWKPGHVALFFAAEAVWATPEKVTAEAAPAFADDGTGNGPFLMGTDRLVAGGCNNKGMGSFLLDPREPGKAPERLSLGRGDWFYGVATAPDGRLLVSSYAVGVPRGGFVWYAADGRSVVELKSVGPSFGAAPVLREPGKSRVVFAATGVGYAALPHGMLAVFRPNEAVMITQASGLPLPRVEHVAAIGDDLIMAGGGKIVAWRTTVPLPQPDAADLREWPLAGPCVRDINGTMWAFLLDGKISHHDGKQWGEVPIELPNLIPHEMTGDDKGMLQLAAAFAPSGSALFRDGAVTNWPNEPLRAWVESLRQGATRFGDGSPFRLRHMAAGRAEWLWRYDGRSLWDGGREYDYYESPPYRYFWLGTNGTCYRGGADRVWVFANGCWTETEAPPLSIGPDGIRADETGKDRLPVVYDGQLKLPLPAAPAGGKPRSLALQGNEAFIAGPGGGWLGPYRVFSNAYYTVTGRVYPGTNGHYLVADNTLRYQPRQTLKIEGEVLADGNLRRLVCRIAGSEPLYKPRILAFLDGEFLESIAAPDGVDLPPVKPGEHALEVYAADGFGVVSDEPLRLALDGGPEFEVANLELGEEWTLKPQRLQALPTTVGSRSVLGRALEIDADGVVWILVEGGVIAIDSANRQAVFCRFPARELVAARGRVWTPGNYDNARLLMPVYELRREGPRHAVDLYDDLPRCASGPQLSADPAGGIWALGNRTAVRWDGKRTQSWERNVGFTAKILPLPDGAVLQSYEDCFVYRDGKLGFAIRWSMGDSYADNPLFTLGQNYLVMPRRGAIVALDNGRTIDQKSPPGDSFRMDAGGNLYVWNKGQFSRFSGESLTKTTLAACASPSMSPNHDPGGYEFLATASGTVVYTVGDDRLVVVRADEGMVEYGWQQGVQPGRTHAIREAPDGRIWVLRAAQLLLYDPTQPADAIPSAWPGWRAVPVQERFAVGAFGRVWYGNPKRKGFAFSDGTNETTWAQRYPGANAIIVSDSGAAAIGAGTATYLLATGKPPERVQDMQSAVLELIKRGAKSFEGDGAPAVAADGRVYFRGKIWDGQAWQPAPDGRASLDPRGEIYLLCMERSSLPVAYRLDGVKAIPLGQVEKCLIDAYGLRWYDPGILEAQPGCMPVWYASKESPQVSFDMNATRVGIDPHGSLQALPLGDGQFLMRVGAKLHRLDAQGLTRIPGSAVPCGDELDPGWGLRVWPLADGRWALAVHSRLYISPPELRF
ncbi:MAG: hypothetical protein FJ224_07575 [Lentisphaerae bacterium]|nr:hypothetical protein [Lentisphaerota bacterium]